MRRQPQLLILRRDDHKRDALGAIFLGAIDDRDEILAYVARYLGPAFQVRGVEPDGPALRVTVECSRFQAESQNLLRMARSFADRGRPRAAADTFGEALKLDPLNAEALKGLAAIHAAAGEHENAEEKWIRAGEIRGYDGEILRGLATVALRLNRTGSAMQYLEDALVVNPSDDDAKAILQDLKRQAELRFNQRSAKLEAPRAPK
jgi:tetratricopeptide (TPR) repeat protein